MRTEKIELLDKVMTRSAQYAGTSKTLLRLAQSMDEKSVEGAIGYSIAGLVALSEGAVGAADIARKKYLEACEQAGAAPFATYSGE